MSRVKWKCPGCKVAYMVPDATDLVLCPDCRVEPVKNKPTRRKKQSSWGVADIAFTVVSLSVLIGLLTLIGIPIWNALKPERDPNKLLVRQWLTENLEDGNWDEVKWYPARTVQGLKDLNLQHIIEMMEADKQAFEKGTLKEDRSSDYQELYNKVRDSEARTFCALKFRTTTLNGQAKALRNQSFEITNGKAKALRANEIREADSPFLKNRIVASYDGWRYFEDHDFEPFPNERIEGLDKRFLAASVWKAPAVVISAVPVTPVSPNSPVPPNTLASHNAALTPGAPLRDNNFRGGPQHQVPRPDLNVPEIPRRLREYLEREVQMKAVEAAVLEKRIASFETRRRSAKPSQISAIEERIRQTNDELTEVRRKRFTAAIPDHPIVGDIGALAVMEVIEVVDNETVLARWFANGKGRLPRFEVVIHSIETAQFKEGDAIGDAELVYQVTATKDEPSETLEKLIAAGKKPEFIVEAADHVEIKKWRVEFEKEMRNKK